MSLHARYWQSFIQQADAPARERATRPLPSAPAPSSPRPTPQPTAANRLGFYLHLSTDHDGLWEAIYRIQPPVLLVHADTLNRMLLREIRQFRAPNTFVVARLYKDSNTQRQWLTSDDPAARGREMAEEILALDFGLATERGANGRLLIDAWMSLNEAVPGPASRHFAEFPTETTALLHAYDLFQHAFHQRLQAAGVEAVAFNFGAGNFSTPAHYLDHFPRTLATHTYLGFHEYGWPTLHPTAGSVTSATTYRACLEGIRAQYGARHRVIITEAGLTRMHKNPAHGDVGWLNTAEPLTQAAYWETLRWYNNELAADDYVVGACLYQVGHHGDWATFRHLGVDNDSRPLTLVDEIAKLNPGNTRGTSHGRGRRPRRARQPGTLPGQRRATRAFVHVHQGEFVVDGRALRFIGVNVRGLVHYGDGHTLPFTTHDHIREQVRAARAMGAAVIRVFLPSVHADTPTTIARLRELLALLRAEAPDIYILPALCNLYRDIDLRVPGDDRFYAPIDPHFNGDLLTADFFMGGYRQNYLPFVQEVVTALRDEPAIFAWEIGNELKLNPVGSDLENDPNIAAFLAFMHTTAREIRRLDPNHLITTGMISTHHAWLHTPHLRHKLYGGPEFDFITVHCYNDERHNDDSDLAHALGKPFIVEEAGYGRGYGDDRSDVTRTDMALWFSKGSRGYMPWGFMATGHDIGDGDQDSGLDRALHADWETMFALLRSQAEMLAHEAASITVPTPPRESPVQIFAPEQRVYSTEWLNIRRTPGYIGKLGDDVLGMLASAQPAIITGRAVAQDGLIWWPVRATLDNGTLVDGWAAEANAEKPLLTARAPRTQGTTSAPASTPRGAARLAPGVPGQARPSPHPALYATTYVNLRHTPGYVGKPSDDLLGQIPYGAQVEPSGGTRQVDALTWHRVRAPLLDNTVATGWAAAHDADGVTLLAATPPAAPITNVGGTLGIPFQPGETLTLLAVANLLPAASLSTKGASIVASLLPNSTLTVTAGPELRGDLEWWQTTQAAADGQTQTGWAALTTEDGTRLLATHAIATQIHVDLPFAGNWPLSQQWGLNPQLYGTILYDEVPLKGHNGLDFATPPGTPLLASDGGKVLRVDYEEKGFGHFVLLQHAWGETLYAHLEQIDVAQGSEVARGQQLGLSGNSGFSFGPHLHYGLRIYPYRRTDGWGGFVNPTPFLPLARLVAGRAVAYVDRWTPLPGWVRP